MIKAYLELTKPRITMLVLITAVFGYYLANGEMLSFRMLWLMLGSFLICSGAGALNHFSEREWDAQMPRTQNRPLPTGTIQPVYALAFGTILVVCGASVLFLMINYVTALLSVLTVILYIFIYTPLKRVTWLNTTIGAIPGALPPMGGWAAATGEIGLGAWFLFGILFLWQHPHFYVIAWLCKDDYAKAGYRMLPIVDEIDGRWTAGNIFIFMLLLVGATILPFLMKFFGLVYLAGVMVAGFFLFASGISFLTTKSREDAREFLKATVYYLPAVFFSIWFDRFLAGG